MRAAGEVRASVARERSAFPASCPVSKPARPCPCPCPCADPRSPPPSPRQLMENQISTVERGAFDDLKELERL